MPQPPSSIGPASALELRVLGEMALLRGGEPLDLPPSKKTRALLAYLAVTGKAHRRDRLCSLLWDVTDDPRGALRWSLSKLRALVDEADAPRILADREHVRLETVTLSVDWSRLRDRLAGDLGSFSTEQLRGYLAEFRGEFLEGLELADFHDFQAWCVAQRQAAREANVSVLWALVEQLGRSSDAALPLLRTLVALEPLESTARALLVASLAARGSKEELQLQLGAAEKLFRECGRLDEFERVRAAARPASSSTEGDSGPPAARAKDEPAPPSSSLRPLVGRAEPWRNLVAALRHVSGERRSRLLLLIGEPGLGKTRLLEELRREAVGQGACVLEGRSYEAELARPYGPWTDALGRLPGHFLGDALRKELSLLLPDSGTEASGSTRERLFGAVSDLLAARAHSEPVVLLFDDLQWCDEASAELIHYAARMNVHRPVLFVLAARGGELPDNPAVERALRGLRREGRLEALTLEPLDRDATRELLGHVGDLTPELADEVHRRSAGNPLYAMELARALRSVAEGDLPSSLRGLLRDRVARLPPAAADVLRWCAVLGAAAQLPWLRRLCGLDAGQLADALEVLERHGMVQLARHGRAPEGSYEFTHDLVRQAVYAEMSEPRRRLMHLQVADMLAPLALDQDALVLDLARHAGLAGEPSLGAEACVRAGRRCVRLFANREALALAKRGLRLVEQLPPRERLQRRLELRQVELAARRPQNLTAAAKELEELADQALDVECPEHARLGYHLASYLRWEQGAWEDAKRAMLQAERISRGSNENERVLALAEAARCLTLLQRDLPHAEALLLEAEARAHRAALEVVAIPDALGLLRWYKGRLEDAAQLFEQARSIAHEQGDRQGEFRALEHRLLVELERGELDRADVTASELLRLGERLREGSDLPFAKLLVAVVRRARGDAKAEDEVASELQNLRTADAKLRLVLGLLRAAELDLATGAADRALLRAQEALDVAERLERPSEVVLACVCGVIACETERPELARELVRRALAHPKSSLSFQAKQALEALAPEEKESSRHVG